MTIFKPLMDSPETDAPAMPVDKGLMGAYIHDATVLQRFFKARIPVWHIVDMKDLPVILRESQYVFPRPDIIVTVNMEEKVNSYLVSWLHLQTPLFAHLTVTEQVPQNMYHQELQTVLVLGFLHLVGESGGLATRQWDNMRKIMKGYLQFPLHADNATLTVFWQGKAYKSLTTEECWEICWEMVEVNFCLNASASAQTLDVWHCFSDGRQLPGQIDVGSANYGLAHHLWLHQALYIFAMKRLMKTWEGTSCPAFLDIVKSTGWTKDEFLSLKNSIAAHYANTFFLYFGCTPVLPHQLAHQTLDMYVPEPRD
ncbi:hypothetical protein EDD85DRAFT_782991 [Armillaria nabsnona]|nr:hypothetical protein EDD85DRAFT_782991 [Armillaria nabsnona]